LQKLIIFDIDGTLLPEQSQFLLLKYLRNKQVIGIVYFARLYFWFALYKVGIAKDPTRVFQYAISFLEGKSKKEAILVMEDFVKNEMDTHFFQEMLVLLESHKARMERVILLSNAMDVLVAAIAKHLGVIEYIGTELEIGEDTLFTGGLVSGITYGEAKIEKLKSYLGNEESARIIKGASCYTDHHSDIPLLDIVDKPIVVNPTPRLESVAKERQWQIMRPE